MIQQFNKGHSKKNRIPNLGAPYNCLINVFCNLFDRKNKDTYDHNLIEIAEDSGCGPVSKGMIFLELVSSARRRRNWAVIDNLELPPSAPVDLMFNKALGDVEKAEIIMQCLGVTPLGTIMEEIDDTSHEIFIAAMTDIYDRVADGYFYRRNHRVLIPYLKTCARKSLKHLHKTKKVL